MAEAKFVWLSCLSFTSVRFLSVSVRLDCWHCWICYVFENWEKLNKIKNSIFMHRSCRWHIYVKKSWRECQALFFPRWSRVAMMMMVWIESSTYLPSMKFPQVIQERIMLCYQQHRSESQNNLRLFEAIRTYHCHVAKYIPATDGN